MSVLEARLTPQERVFVRALGGELEAQRKLLGLTVQQVSKALDVGERTFYSYEHGERQVNATRFTRWCGILGVNAGEMLNRAAEKARVYTAASWRIDLRKVAADSTPQFGVVQQWAKNMLAHRSGVTARMEPPEVRTLAMASDCTHSVLADYLVQFLSNSTTDLDMELNREPRPKINRTESERKGTTQMSEKWIEDASEDYGNAMDSGDFRGAEDIQAAAVKRVDSEVDEANS